VRPLDRLRSLKVKLGVVIVAAIAAAYAVNEFGLALDFSFKIRVIVAMALSLAMVQFLAHGMTSPLRDMAAATRAMATGDYSRRVRATSRDELGELARAFNRMAADLAKVDRQRRDLVANASHELRTPITALQALLENLVDGVEQPDPRSLQVALEQTERLGRLVAELLDLSQLESGAAQIVAETVPLNEFVQQAVSEARLAGRNVRLTADVVPTGLTVKADAARLHQVLANLLDNASRHSPPGGRVTVSARQHDGGVRLSVCDVGPGIPAADRDRVFERFSRLDGGRMSRASRDGGGGLGLAIAREVVELHGGELRAEENTPSGCRMVVDLPGGESVNQPADGPATGPVTDTAASAAAGPVTGLVTAPVMQTQPPTDPVAPAPQPPAVPPPPPPPPPGWTAWPPPPPGWRPAPPPPGWQPPHPGPDPRWPQPAWGPPFTPPPKVLRSPPAAPPPRALFGAVLGAGLVAALAMPGSPPGLGLLVATLAVGAAVLLPLRLLLVRADKSTRPPPWPLAFTALAYALVAMTLVRAAPWVAAVNLLAAVGLATLAVSRAVDWLGIVRGVQALVVAAVRAPAWMAAPIRRTSTEATARNTYPAIRGLAVAALLLTVFGLLFVSADAAFADLLGRAVPTFDGRLIPARILTGVAAALFAGAAALMAVRPALDPIAPGTAATRRRVEWVLPLAALNILFAAFVAVQLTVLFGGDEHVLRTAGLTYADYARQGFWQLLVAATLTLGIVALAVRLVPREARRERILLRLLLGCLCALTLVVLASAVKRLDLYEEAYGLTRLRITAQATAYWLAAVFVLTLVAGTFRRARWLPRAAMVSIALGLIAFSVSNPDRRIAESAVARAQHGQPVDHAYLSRLSSDAVPTLQRLPDGRIRACALGPIANRLKGDTAWANWNLARDRADESLRRRPLAGSAACEADSRRR